MSDETFLDFESVRETLVETQERRGFLTYEQKLALQHAEWAASTNRNGIKTEKKIFKNNYKKRVLLLMLYLQENNL